MTGWDRPELAHLSRIEKKCAALWFKVNPDHVLGPPTGMLIGEMPGRTTSPDLPLFPYPRNSAGGRLLKMSGLTIGEYLGRLIRINLIPHYAEKWDPEGARIRAEWLVKNSPVDRIVLLGQHVGAAFGFSSFFHHETVNDKTLVCIPHPSGRNRVYNDERARLGAAATMKFAADELTRPRPVGRMQ